MHRNTNFRPSLVATALVATLILPVGAQGRLSDTTLFGAFVAPNVVVIVDNSSSMANVIWHEAYDPSVAPSCTVFDNAETYYIHDSYGSPSGPAGSDTTFEPGEYTHCGNKREIFVDDAIDPTPTQWSGHYLNWYFSLDEGVPAEDAIAEEIQGEDNGLVSTCIGTDMFDKYRRSRITVAKQILKDVMCDSNASNDVRFGLAEFRRNLDDPAGGYVTVPVDDWEDTQQSALDDALDAIEPETWTPIGEALFQVYTYFMNRDDDLNVRGKNGKEKFPKYEFETERDPSPGGDKVGTNDAPPTPITIACEKAYVVIISDGQPTKDDFDNSPGGEDKKFDKFHDKLIGDYNDDSETEEPGPDGKALYLDDIAKFMYDNDMRLDLAGDQRVRVYTIGLSTDTESTKLLQKTATVGGGQFFDTDDLSGLATAILSTVAVISEDAPTLTAATVPASRVTRNGSFYHAYFEPASGDFWPGHIKNYDYTLAGEIQDKDGNCAIVGDPDPCTSGEVDTDESSAPSFWDAQDEMPLAASRLLYTSLKDDMKEGKKLGKLPILFTPGNLDKDDLFIKGDDRKLLEQVGSVAGDDNGVADELVEYLRGCEFGSDPCVNRPDRLADIFHSVPLLVGAPNGTLNDPSYLTFAQSFETRSQMLYVGSNGGFLHGFKAAPWDTTLTPARHNRAHADAGKELFGFMPYNAREQIKFLPEPGTPKHYAVDGSPQAADVWLPSSDFDTTKSADEWHTILVGGHRMGGYSYYALDVTDPDDTDASRPYPAYMWEFPPEDKNLGKNGDDWRKWVGETWSEPVITRVRVEVEGSTNGGQGYERWVAVFAGGYYPCTDPNSDLLGEKIYKKKKPITVCEDDEKKKKPGTKKPEKDKAGRAVFMVDIATGSLLAMQNKDETSGMDYAFAGNPSVLDLDYDGFADVIYFGDLGGGIWKWVVTAMGEFEKDEGHKWEQPNWPFVKFFQAPTYTDSGTGDTYYKSFFNPPTAVLVKGTLWLSMATGEREALHFEGLDDSSDTTEENNRVFVVRDLDPKELSGPHAVINGNSTDLADLTADEDGDCGWTTSKKGFYIRAVDGEKFTTKGVSFQGNVFMPSYRPDGSGDVCAGGGDGFLYTFDLYCGGETTVMPGSDPSLDDRVTSLAAGLPARPRVTIGDPEQAYSGSGTPPCEGQVVVTTSHGSSTSACAGVTGMRPVTNENWRQR